jgi:hypothetical protein
MKTPDLNKWPKSVYVFILAAFLVGTLLGTGSGSASRRTPTTVTETIQIPTTYTSFTTATAYITAGQLEYVTVTEGANVADYVAAMENIISQLRDISSKSSAELTAFSNGQVSQADLLAFFTTQKGNLSVLLENTIRLHPPQAFTEAHVHTVRAIADLYTADQIIEDGLTQNNASILSEAITFINQSNNEMDTATSILNSE